MNFINHIFSHIDEYLKTIDVVFLTHGHFDIAILSSSGQFTMGPKEAAYVVKHLLDVEYAIPSHTFPSKEEAFKKEVLDALLKNFPVIRNMMDRDQEFAEELGDYEKTQAVIINYGEAKEF
jgi:L-ascorbate metabolism protein UlaG (beta-lactamase superfamily)